MKYKTDEERLAGKRACKAAYERKRKAMMTPEQRNEERAAHAKYQRERKAAMTPEQRDKAKAAHTQYMRERKAAMTPEQRDKAKAAHTQYMRERKAADLEQTKALKHGNEAGAAHTRSKETKRSATTPEQPAKARAAHAQYQRERKAAMTPEQLAKARAANTQFQRERMAAMTPEQRAKARAYNTQYQRERRNALLAFEQDDESEQRGAEAEAQRNRRARQASEYLDLDLHNKRKRISAMTLEQFEKQTMESEAKSFVCRKEQSLCVKFSKEEREKLISEYLEERLAKIAAMSVEERSQQRAMVYAKRRESLVLLTKLEKKTVEISTAKRIKRLILLSTCAMAKNPVKYKAAATIIHKSLLEIRNLYAEMGDLKKLLQKILSEAVRNAVKFQKGEKRIPEEIQPLTFVDVSLPLEPNTIIQQINTFEAATDPLFFHPGTDVDPLGLSTTSENKRESIEPSNKNEETFKVCSHSAFTLNEENCDEENKTQTFVCSICSKQFGTSLGLTIHQKQHISNLNEFKCSVCQEVFHGYKDMTSHYLQFHSLQFFDIDDEDGNIEIDDEMERCAHEMDFLFSRKCLICFKTFETMRVSLQTFSKHIISHHRENNEYLKNFTYVCVRCNQPHTFFRNLESHWKKFCCEKWKKENKNSTEIVCEHCGTKLSNEKSLSTHLQIFHTKGSQHVCEHCGKGLNSEGSLKHHTSTVHQSGYKFSCEICGRKFKTAGTMRKHAETVHLRVKSYVCKYCSRQFACMSTLNWHENIHKGEKPFQCKLCDKSFAASSSLTIHEGVHDGYKCKICGETCNNYVDLCIHKKLNHRDPNAFVSDPASNKHQIPTSCDICGKSVQGFSALKYHKRTVHVGRDHVCEICGKNYKTPNALANHKYSHDNLKRFGCSLCGREFRQQTNFYQHKRVAHINEDARMVRLIPGTVHKSRRSSNLLISSNNLKQENQNSNPEQTRTSIKTPKLDNAPEISALNIVNFNLEPRVDSPEVEDFFSDTEVDDQDNEHVNTLPRFEVAELSHACLAFENSHMALDDEIVNKDSTLKETVVENPSADESLPSCSKFFDFSRANVPFALPKLFVDEPSTELMEQKIVSSDQIREKNEWQHNVLIEDSEDNTFITDLNTHDLIKLKTETFADIAADDPEDLSDMCDTNDFISDSGNETPGNSAQIADENLRKKDLASPQICPSNLVVKLTRLLEYNCVPCDKTIFALCQREIRQHSRTHQKMVIKKEVKVSKRRKCVTNEKEGDMKGKYSCLYCESKYVRCSKLVEHCLKNHPGQKPLKCAMCSEMFTCFKNLRDHKAKVHHLLPIRDPDGNTESMCELCGKKFSSSGYVKYHILSMHQERKFQCEFCSKFFFRMRDLEIHKKRHLGMKNHLCEECGKAFVTPNELKDHFDRLHKKINRRKGRNREIIKKDKTTHPFSCNICPYVFKKESGLRAHLEMHDPQRKFSCDECGLRFKIFANVKIHHDYKHKKKGKRCIVPTSDN